MPEYTFICGSNRIHAENYEKAMSLCRDGKVAPDAEVIRRSRIGEQRYPLAFDGKLNAAASLAHGIDIPVSAPVSLALLISVASAIVCGVGAVTMLVIAGQGPVERLRWKAFAGFALALIYFSRAAFLELRFRSRYLDPAFRKELSEVDRLCRRGQDVEQAVNALRIRFKLKAEASGLGLRGSLRVFDFSGSYCEIRLSLRNQRVYRLKVTPKYGNA